jgi:radical SAM superfamily enzyme YgiQ (UPF0313 family)
MYVGTAAALTGRYRVEIIDENNWRYNDHYALQQERPADVVGFYCGLSSTMPRVFELAALYKRFGAMTVAGGGHVDALPEEALHNGIDVVVRGEGEASLVELTDAYFAGGSYDSIPGLSYLRPDGSVVMKERRPPVADLDTLPDPDFSLLVDTRTKVKFVPISRTRGCNYRCEFCSVNSRMGQARVSSYQKTLRHLEDLVTAGHRHFFFVDDNFAQDREGALALCEGIAALQRKYRVKLNFTLQVRTQVARDPRLMEALKDAGAKVLCVGIESPIPEDLKNMHKGQNIEDVEYDLRNMRRNGFLIHGMFIFGYPGKLGAETPHSLTLKQRADCYIDFIKRSRIDTLQVLKAVPVPGSRLYERLKAEGRIYPLEEVGWDKYDGNFLLYQPDPGDNAVELQEQATRIMHEFYSPWNILKLFYLGILSPIDWVFYFVRRGAQMLAVKRREFEERYRRPFPASGKWAEFFIQGASGARIEIYRIWRSTMLRIFGAFALRGWARGVNLKHFRQMLKKQQERITNALPEYKKTRKKATE